MVSVYRPTTLTEALDHVALGNVTLFSGGTDLMVQHGVRSGIAPQFDTDVLFLDAISELSHIEATQDGLCIGSECSLSDIESDDQVPEILRLSVGQIAAPALRNRATLSGNICNASPAGDSLPALYLLDARLILASAQGRREVPISDFITGPGKTILKADEILSHILLPKVDLPQLFYRKVGTRAANALSKLSVAGLAKVVEGKVVDWRVAFGAVSPTVVRCKELEQLLIGKNVAEINIEAMVEQYSEMIHPIDDQRTTAKYRHQTSLKLLASWLEALRDV